MSSQVAAAAYLWYAFDAEWYHSKKAGWKETATSDLVGPSGQVNIYCFTYFLQWQHPKVKEERLEPPPPGTEAMGPLPRPLSLTDLQGCENRCVIYCKVPELEYRDDV